METINLDGDEASDGLLALVIAVVELLIEALEGEAIRRMESGSLSDAEIERLGTQLAALHEEIDRLKANAEIDDDVSQLRTDLSALVENAIERVDDDPHPGFALLDGVNKPSSEQPERTDQPDQSPTPPEGEQ